jgi:hypothetical protein
LLDISNGQLGLAMMVALKAGALTICFSAVIGPQRSCVVYVGVAQGFSIPAGKKISLFYRRD